MAFATAPLAGGNGGWKPPLRSRQRRFGNGLGSGKHDRLLESYSSVNVTVPNLLYLANREANYILHQIASADTKRGPSRLSFVDVAHCWRGVSYAGFTSSP